MTKGVREISEIVKKMPQKTAPPVMPMYVPAKQLGHMMEDGKKMPVHHMDVMTRAEFVGGNIADESRHGGLGAAYKNYFWAVVCFALTVITMGINLYLSAVFAYATGYCWSQRFIAVPWNIPWFKGKALYHTT